MRVLIAHSSIKIIPMKYILISLVIFIQSFSFGQTTISEAQDKAVNDNKKILLVFTGSDWCKPCIQLKKDILNTDSFEKFSRTKLVQLDVDFPYKSKNKLSKEQTEHNESLADSYNKSGDFPKMVLIDANLNYVKTIKYDSKMTTIDLIFEIEKSL